MKKTILTLIIFSTLVSAHDMWIDTNNSVHYGHKQSTHAHGDNRVLSQEKMLSIECLENGKTTTLYKEHKCSATFFILKPVYYTKTPYGVKEKPKNETKMPISSLLSLESIKRINSNSGLKSFNKGLELTLRNKPSEIEIGDKARLIVLFDGKPKSGVRVANAERTIGVSDEDGHVNVRIKQKGLQNIKASFEKAGDTIVCDKLVYETTLNFEVNE